MTIWSRLRARLIRDCSMHCADDFTTYRPGRHQKAAGAWSWASKLQNGPPWISVGSQWPMRELLKAPRLVASYDRDNNDWNIDPELK